MNKGIIHISAITCWMSLKPMKFNDQVCQARPCTPIPQKPYELR